MTHELIQKWDMCVHALVHEHEHVKHTLPELSRATDQAQQAADLLVMHYPDADALLTLPVLDIIKEISKLPVRHRHESINLERFLLSAWRNYVEELDRSTSQKELINNFPRHSSEPANKDSALNAYVKKLTLPRLFNNRVFLSTPIGVTYARSKGVLSSNLSALQTFTERILDHEHRAELIHSVEEEKEKDRRIANQKGASIASLNSALKSQYELFDTTVDHNRNVARRCVVYKKLTEFLQRLETSFQEDTWTRQFDRMIHTYRIELMQRKEADPYIAEYKQDVYQYANASLQLLQEMCEKAKEEVSFFACLQHHADLNEIFVDQRNPIDIQLTSSYQESGGYVEFEGLRMRNHIICEFTRVLCECAQEMTAFLQSINNLSKDANIDTTIYTDIVQTLLDSRRALHAEYNLLQKLSNLDHDRVDRRRVRARLEQETIEEHPVDLFCKVERVLIDALREVKSDARRSVWMVIRHAFDYLRDYREGVRRPYSEIKESILQKIEECQLNLQKKVPTPFLDHVLAHATQLLTLELPVTRTAHLKLMQNVNALERIFHNLSLNAKKNMEDTVRETKHEDGDDATTKQRLAKLPPLLLTSSQFMVFRDAFSPFIHALKEVPLDLWTPNLLPRRELVHSLLTMNQSSVDLRDVWKCVFQLIVLYRCLEFQPMFTTLQETRKRHMMHAS